MIGILLQISTKFLLETETFACVISLMFLTDINPLPSGWELLYNPIKYAKITATIIPIIELVPKYLIPFENKLNVINTNKKNFLYTNVFCKKLKTL